MSKKKKSDDLMPLSEYVPVKERKRKEGVRLTVQGYEIPDGRSLVAVCDLKPVSMGDRIKRYVRSPSLRDDLVFSDDQFDPDDWHDDEDRPMSPHEERYGEYVDRKKRRKTELDKKKAEEAAELERKENEKFRARVLEVKEDIPKST